MRLGLVCAVLGLAGCSFHPGPFNPVARGPVGLPHHGVLTQGVALPDQGLGWVRLRSDSVSYGTPTLVQALQAACAEVGSQESPCVVADMSAPHGGALLPKHASHRTGRDADVLFFVTDLSGQAVRSPGFMRFESHGLAQDAAGKWYRFDTARNWALLRALVGGDESRVEWVFVHPVIRQWLLRFGRTHGESRDLLTRAETVLGIAGGPKAPHDDHMHLRVSCQASEVAEGCLNTAPIRDWVHAPPYSGPGEEPDFVLALSLAAEQGT